METQGSLNMIGSFKIVLLLVLGFPVILSIDGFNILTDFFSSYLIKSLVDLEFLNSQSNWFNVFGSFSLLKFSMIETAQCHLPDDVIDK